MLTKWAERRDDQTVDSYMYLLSNWHKATLANHPLRREFATLVNWSAIRFHYRTIVHVLNYCDIIGGHQIFDRDKDISPNKMPAPGNKYAQFTNLLLVSYLDEWS